MSDSDGKNDKRHYNCVIWPENHGTDAKKCVIHELERGKLGWGGDLAVRVDVFPSEDNPRTLVVSYFTIEGIQRANPLTSSMQMNIKVQRQFSQNWDKGGCYLNPQETA